MSRPKAGKPSKGYREATNQAGKALQCLLNAFRTVIPYTSPIQPPGTRVHVTLLLLGGFDRSQTEACACQEWPVATDRNPPVGNMRTKQVYKSQPTRAALGLTSIMNILLCLADRLRQNIPLDCKVSEHKLLQTEAYLNRCSRIC